MGSSRSEELQKKEGKKGKPQMAEEDVDNDRPPPPKRPMAAFFMYLADVRQQVKQDNPQFGGTGTLQGCGRDVEKCFRGS